MKIFFSVTTAIILFAMYAFLPISGAPTRFVSPDEASNYFFTAHFAKTGTLTYAEPINLIAENRIHPRSIKSIDGLLVPGGFLGLPVIFGGIAAVFGEWIIPFLTPMFAVLAVFSVFGLTRHFLGTRVAVFTSLFLATHAAFWYSSARTLQPNILFFSLLLFSEYLFFVTPLGKLVRIRGGSRFGILEHVDGMLAGIFFGLALAVRTSEAYWMIPVAILTGLLFWKNIPWRRVALTVLFTVFTFAPFLSMNAVLYGSPFATGYSGVSGGVPVGETLGGLGARLLGPLAPALFPLGFAPRTALTHFFHYGISLFSVWSVFFCVAFVFIFKKIIHAWRATLVSVFGIVWLLLFYGSWTIRDNPDPEAITIGASYIRYWIPLFSVGVLVVAIAAEKMFRVWRVPRAGFVAVFALLFAWNAGLVFLGDEGILAVREKMITQEQFAVRVTELTPRKSIIVTDRADKFLFPERKVMYPLRDEGVYALLPILSNHVSLYYFGITLPAEDFAYLRDTKLPTLGLTIKNIENFGEETLYHFEKL